MERAQSLGSDTVFTDEQKRLIQALKDDVAPIVENHAGLKLFCNEHTYVRYLRARQWNFHKASKMLHDTLKWRMEYHPELIRFDDIKEESVTGKNQVYFVPDKLGRPIVLMRPRCENTKTHDRQVKFLIYILERASRIADERSVHKIAYVLDFEGYTSANAAPLNVSLQCNHILAHHYPERMGVAVMYKAPVLFSLTWKAVRPFLDPVTKGKILFADKGKGCAEVMSSQFDMRQMETCMGGALEGVAFDLDRFEDECRRYDALVEAELRTLTAQLQGGPAEAGKGAAAVSVDGAVSDKPQVVAVAR